MKLNPKISGLDAVLKKLKYLETDLKDEAEDIVEAGVFDMNADAVSRIQAQNIHDTGTLLRGQQVVPITNGFAMANNVKYAPYHEFGTGGLVQIPEGWGAYALQFKGKGLRNVQLKPRPFFIPAYLKGGQQIVTDLRELIKDAIK